MAWKDVLRKESEEGVLLNGLKKLIMKISGQNTDNMNKYIENMTNLVSSLKDSITKDESVKDSLTATVSVGAKVTKFTKPIKVPT